MGKKDSEYRPVGITTGTEPKWYRSKLFYLELIRRCLAEFFGTTLFVFAGVMSTRDTDTDHNYDISPSSVTAVALGHGLAIMAMVASFAHIRWAAGVLAGTCASVGGGGLERAFRAALSTTKSAIHIQALQP